MILKKDKNILRGAAPAFFVDFFGERSKFVQNLIQNSFKIRQSLSAAKYVV